MTYATSPLHSMVHRLREAAAECGHFAKEPHYLFDNYDDVPADWPEIPAGWHTGHRDPTEWLCEPCAAHWLAMAAELGASRLDPARLVTRDDAENAGLCGFGIDRFCQTYLGGAESASIAELRSLLAVAMPTDARGVATVLSHVAGMVDGDGDPISVRSLYDRQSDSPRWCELCGCPLAFEPTDYCLKEELEHHQEHRGERYDASELCVLAELIDGTSEDDTETEEWLDICRDALANLFVTAEDERERRAFSLGKLAGAWKAMRREWRDRREDAA